MAGGKVCQSPLSWRWRRVGDFEVRGLYHHVAERARNQSYQEGHGGEVVKVDWKPGSIVSPPSGWFHQHFNLGSEEARQLALRYGSKKYPTGFWTACERRDEGVFTSVKEGGTLIEYEDEDLEIRWMYEAALKGTGVSFTMPPLQR